MNVEIRKEKVLYQKLSPRRIRYLPHLLTISGLGLGRDLREHNLKIEAINCLPT